jgi:plastocyanin
MPIRMRLCHLTTAAAAAVALLAFAGPAQAAPKTTTFRYGPITVGPYEVKQSDLDFGIPKPAQDGYVTGLEVDIVTEGGRKVPISRLMLHHIVFSNMGTDFGQKRDGTCNRFTLLDSKTQVPGIAERFYAAGEERAKMRLPAGYGYPVKGADRWAMTWMLMNHRKRTDRAYIQYRVTTDDAPRREVKPYWLDVRNCLADPVFDVPGGRKRGSTTTESAGWNVPESGRIVAAGGHVHGGAKSLSLNRGSCEMFASKPTWGLPRHPFYNVKPVLHEPGPINMSSFTSRHGFPVRRGDRLRLDADYDGELVHTRVMGIMLAYLAPDPAAKPAARCRKPADLRRYGSDRPGRRKPPRFEVPLIGLGRDGVAREIPRPPGRRVALRAKPSIGVHGGFFPPNVSVRAGSRVRWDFGDERLHNVTVASGPRGFSSKHLNSGRSYSKRLRVPGTYKVFCGLHPVQMTATVKVVRRQK